MDDDTKLLGRFAAEGSQEAFGELVRRKVDLVFAAALRQTGGDAHLAQDVTQMVFVTLAREAARLRQHAVLTGWLFTTTRFLALSAMRRQRRWLRREQEAVSMNLIDRESTCVWDDLRPVIDEALQELAEKDRVALLLRFFEGRSLAEVGTAVGLAENAARMRVDRALEKLRGRLARRGITSTAAALGGALAAQPAVAAPAGLAAGAIGAGLAAAAVSGSGFVAAVGSIFAIMNATKLAAGAAVLIAVGTLGGYLGARYQSAIEGGGTAGGAGATTPARDLPARLAASPATPAAAASAGSGPTGAGATAAGAGSTQAALDSLRVLLDLQRRKLAAPGVTLVENGTGITDQFAELFALTAAEREALQNSLVASYEQLGALKSANTEVTRSPNGGVIIEVKPFPDKGGAVYDAMLRTFADTLGAERYAAFVALGSEQAEKVLGRFGTTHRKITLSREVVGGEMRYRINDRANYTPEDKSQYVNSEMTRAQLRDQLGSLAEILPPDFAPR